MPRSNLSTRKKSGGNDQISRPQGAPRGLLFLYIMHKIAIKPAHGYELLQDIESKTNGAWRPGAGSIYPMLKKMVAKGYIEIESMEKGGTEQRVYSITPTGINFLHNTKKIFSGAGQRWSAMRGIFVELMDAEELTKFFTDGMRMQSDLAQEILTSKMDKLSKSEVEYMLREYLLVLERQLYWANQILSEIRNPESKPSKG